ncbi:MAG: hypothetical protein HW407_2009 [Bacteroidetes bacterium]|nr:hypothetical protein [Bacteroidota bacterium]
MNRSTLLWITSIIITVIAAVYQRVTGPTYPLSGKVHFAGKEFEYNLARSHAGETSATVDLQTDDASISGTVLWKLHKTADPLQESAMKFENGILKTSLPLQPYAGKVQYQIRLVTNTGEITMLPAAPVVLRFRGEVPLFVLVPHVLLMFTAMLFSTRAGLEYFNVQPGYLFFARWTIMTLLAGGFIFGPLMQWYAFDTWWTGWPVGRDLTDNKTAVALILWLAALFSLKRSKSPGKWVLVAATGLLLVYLIPHSLLGSELEYREFHTQPR